jgi:hypothetical protein
VKKYAIVDIPNGKVNACKAWEIFLYTHGKAFDVYLFDLGLIFTLFKNARGEKEF